MGIKNHYLLEFVRLSRLTAPIVLAQLSQTAMGFVDTIMAGRVSSVDLAAVAVGASLFFPCFLFMVGLLSAVTPLVAQAHGRRDRGAAQGAVQQGIITGVLIGVVVLLLLQNCGPVLNWIQVAPQVAPLTERYLFAASWGFPPAGVFLALRSCGDGLSQTRLSMFAGFVGLAVNIVANYIFIYGKLGIPAMGGVGCGWATTISILAMLIAILFMLQKNKQTAVVVGLNKARKELFRGFGGVLTLGLPIGLALFVECSIFSVIALIISQLGAEIVAAHQIALNFTSLLFMIPYSLSMALTIRVGFTIGRNQQQRLITAVKTGLATALFCAALTCLFITFCAGSIAAMYTPDAAVQQLAATLLLFAAIFQIPDALQVNCSGALRGCKDTRVPMLLMIMAYWGIGLPVGYMLGMQEFLGMTPGPQGFWIGLICGLTTSAILQGRRLYRLLQDIPALVSSQHTRQG